MSIHLHVQWPNAAHPLLAGPTVQVAADGADVPAAAQQPGKHVFEIPDGTSAVLVKARFDPTLPITRDGVQMQETFNVLLADQAYRVVGTTLVPDPTPFTLVNGQVVVQNVHPLIDLVSAGNAASGVAVAEVRTEFVDATPIWRRAASRLAFEAYEHDTEPGNGFVALGATAGTPPLWFAHFPLGLEPPSPEVGTLVFFRPALPYHYTTAFDKRHGGGAGQFNLNRYLLAPRDPESKYFINGEVISRGDVSWWFIRDFIALRASFQEALLRSGKPLVMLHPWPTNGTSFGDASTAKLPVAVRGILRLLRGMGHLGHNHAAVTPGRLGLAGYSAGGPPMMTALQHNRHLVQELYLFDPIHLAAAAPFVIQWATHTPDFRLRMTGANVWTTVQGIAAGVRKAVSGEAGDFFVTAKPDDPAFWKPVAKGGSPYWNFAIQKHPGFENDFAVRHQFAVFGGERIEIQDNRMLDHETWLEAFLKASAY